MNTDFRFMPESASTLSGKVDLLYYFLLALTAVLTTLVAGLIVFFAIRYRRDAQVNREVTHPPLWVEVSWLIAPIPVLMLIFYWGASLFYELYHVPENAMEITVVGKQWMWKFQHPQGKREIDELHVPANRPVKLTMISQDVIHSLYFPAFRQKHDVLPGRYSQMWFEANQTGEYHLFCAEYCGTNHSRMKGRVVVMSPSDYEAWLGGSARNEPPAVTGAKLFEQYRCNSCHRPAGEPSRGPPLANLFAHRVPLTIGQSVVADENYLRESILRPQAKIVAGFQPLMPTFEGQISEEGIAQIIAYIKSLAPAEESK